MEICTIRSRAELTAPAAEWFASKWGIPAVEYSSSMAECALCRSAVPQWYLAMDGDKIAGGCGVIENDFHDRRDLAPNLCALYVEPEYRGRGLAGELLSSRRGTWPLWGQARCTSSRSTTPSMSATAGNISAPPARRTEAGRSGSMS